MGFKMSAGGVAEMRVFEESACDGGEGRGLTVHGLALLLVDAVVLGDKEVELMVRTGDGADLVFLIDEIAEVESVVRSWLVVGYKVNAYPKPSRSAGNSGSLGSVVLRRRNILVLCFRVLSPCSLMVVRVVGCQTQSKWGGAGK